MKKLILIGVMVLTGCTGITSRVSPEASYQAFNTPYNSVGVRTVSSDKTFKEAGDLNSDFASIIRTEGFAKDVYFPARPDDKVDITLDTKFESSVDIHNPGLKGFFIGFTLFLIEPFVWFDFDYQFAGEVSVFKDKQLINKVSAKTDANISAKYLSLSDLKKEQDEVLSKAKKSLFAQLLAGIYNVKARD
ncbi:MAG: hypothetical protein ABL903_17025 [Methylococcales bacterium]